MVLTECPDTLWAIVWGGRRSSKTQSPVVLRDCSSDDNHFISRDERNAIRVGTGDLQQ